MEVVKKVEALLELYYERGRIWDSAGQLFVGMASPDLDELCSYDEQLIARMHTLEDELIGILMERKAKRKPL